MKVLVLSDSHGNITPMVDAVSAAEPDQVIHLGDYVMDAKDLSYVFYFGTGRDVIFVKGNVDGRMLVAPTEQILEWEGVRIFATHGHLYDVKEGLDKLLDAAKAENADVVLYGHTHEPVCTQIDGMWVVNPGTVARKETHTYAMLTLENGQVSCEILPVIPSPPFKKKRRRKE